jgi:large subunit ribosomal protein L19e
MKLESIRRIAAQMLKTGEKNVWFSQQAVGEIAKCITREDIWGKIKAGAIKKLPGKWHSRGMARILHEKRRLGRKRGFGKRRGSRKARSERKRSWIARVRAQRVYLRKLRAEKKLSDAQYAKIYRMVNGGYFKGKRYIDLAIKQTGGKR